MITTTNLPAASCALLSEGCPTSCCFRSSSHSSRIRSTKPSVSRPLPGVLLRALEGLPSPRALLTATKHKARVIPTVAAAAWFIPTAEELAPAQSGCEPWRSAVGAVCRQAAETNSAVYTRSILAAEEQRWTIPPLAKPLRRGCRQEQEQAHVLGGWGLDVDRIPIE